MIETEAANGARVSITGTLERVGMKGWAVRTDAGEVLNVGAQLHLKSVSGEGEPVRCPDCGCPTIQTHMVSCPHSDMTRALAREQELVDA